MIDIATRFPRTSLKEAWIRSQQSEKWVFPDTVCSSVTMIYGRSNVGKAYLVSSMLLSLMVDDREFLGMQPTNRTKVWRPAILWTDPGSDEEYAERIYPELPEEAELGIFHTGRTTQVAEWAALADHLVSEGFNFVVVDNLQGVTGDTNEAGTVTTVFDGLTKLTNRGVPVVVLHHESEKGRVVPGASPMGTSTAVQKSRTWIQVRQTNRRGLRGGNTAMVIQSNALDQPQQLVAEPLTGPAYRRVNRGPWTSTDNEEKAPKQDRNVQVLDRNAEVVEWIVNNGQGVGVNKLQDQLTEKFPEKKASTWRYQLLQGALSKMLRRTGEGDSTRWVAVSGGSQGGSA
ncbi:AAA family ATPase [Nocardia speluncae]|uniref:AAA family ATPase n=1 Tax=Nocardia speluncae TaxID=419477 RepID=A0A846XIR3_9NOCA|nr:AAA family ATPase [Nocardia speluncae]NKY35235.1 AAA family ATPase [Nocardia speluncae]